MVGGDGDGESASHVFRPPGGRSHRWRHLIVAALRVWVGVSRHDLPPGHTHPHTDYCSSDDASSQSTPGVDGAGVDLDQCVGRRMVGCSWGSCRVMGPQVSMTNARAASGLWKPRARLNTRRTTEFSPSARALLMPSRNAAMMPSRCFLMVLAVLTNAGSRDREPGRSTGRSAPRLARR